MRLRSSLSVSWPGFFLALAFGAFAAQAPAQSTATAPNASSHKTPPALVETSPKWSELNAAQQTTLAPLEHLWSSLDENRKR
jgi:hypothetical protein